MAYDPNELRMAADELEDRGHGDAVQALRGMAASLERTNGQQAYVGDGHSVCIEAARTLQYIGDYRAPIVSAVGFMETGARLAGPWHVNETSQIRTNPITRGVTLNWEIDVQFRNIVRNIEPLHESDYARASGRDGVLRQLSMDMDRFVTRTQEQTGLRIREPVVFNIDEMPQWLRG